MYDGTAPDPNPSLHSGHILGSTNLPFMMLLDPHTKTMKDKQGIREGEPKMTMIYIIVHTISVMAAWYIHQFSPAGSLVWLLSTWYIHQFSPAGSLVWLLNIWYVHQFSPVG